MEFASYAEYIRIRDILLKKVQRREFTETVLHTEIPKEYLLQCKRKLSFQEEKKEQTLAVFYQPLFSKEEQQVISLEASVGLFEEPTGWICGLSLWDLATQLKKTKLLDQFLLEEVTTFLAKHVLPSSSLGIEYICLEFSDDEYLKDDLPSEISTALQRHHVPASMLSVKMKAEKAVQLLTFKSKMLKELFDTGVSVLLTESRAVSKRQLEELRNAGFKEQEGTCINAAAWNI